MKLDPRAVSPQTLAAAAFRLRELGIVDRARRAPSSSSRPRDELPHRRQLAEHRDRRRDGRRRRGRRDDGRPDAEHRPQRRLDRRPERLRRPPTRSPTTTGSPIVLIALLAVAVGLACGLVNGLLVAVGRDPGDHRHARDARDLPRAGLRGHRRRRRQHLGVSSCRTDFLDLAAEKPLGLPMLAWIALVVALAGAAIAPLGSLGDATSTRSGRTPTRRAGRDPCRRGA